VDGLVCDLDGVIYRGEDPIPGAAAALDRLRGAGVRIVLCTNNSRATVEQYRAKLRRMGVQATPDEILTSAVVTGEVLADRGLEGARALVVGGEGLRESLSLAGLSVVERAADQPVDVVAVGLDTTFDYQLLRRAADAVRGGAAFVASNDDATFPAEKGATSPGAGAILAAVEVASGRRAEVMGKPHEPMMDAAERRLAGARSIAVVGDRPETDLAGGRRKGWKTILVLSGVTSAQDARNLDDPPDAILSSVADLRPSES
jgi:phosphoglycolate/pyridoxal phosphate phosphatase family enzyme